MRCLSLPLSSTLCAIMPRVTKLIIIGFTILNLAGCPVTIRALLRNQTPKPVVVFGIENYGEAKKIPSNSESEMFWFRGCITVVDNGVLQFFDGNEIPERFVEKHVFSTSINLIYKDLGLSYVNQSGETISLPKIEACNGA